MSWSPSLLQQPRWLGARLPLLSTRWSSSRRWQARQTKDHFTKEAAAQGLKSRAAFKLLQIDEKYRVFKSGQTVVDLGYAPGSWSQMAVIRTKPNGRVLGVDISPAQPLHGVSAIQGNFLDPKVQDHVQWLLRGLDRDKSSAINSRDTRQDDRERTVDVVLSDMMMNTSGINSKDHTGSMDLCRAALLFSSNVLKIGGHFICKFYQGAEDRDLETQLKGLFEKVHRVKPPSSRNVRMR
ncbi:23S ribosomal RNA methyltransferase [Aspergillus steynii IBT 23096]|uniref:rRNA methyltransferase 2, mitochondrial n=1 Tax=Aspergillus steynii IBT 23096 TaxID=1392250 RepID=A0A2I2GCC3_9EURO|nr:23S ribosomal RNA methyltransferase [Aspergillus steynii IBT 23096]PLB50505.1 23S ribosomal RNA methyltransferase [Aspergillus steynii IBT 23096]